MEPAAALDPDEAAPPPATWASRVPDGPWCPERIAAQLDATLISAAAREPRTIDARHGAWDVTAASIRGRSHAHRGDFRDDAVAVASDGALTVLAVADGAGSSALSRVGAAVTADVAVRQTLARYAATAADANAATRLGTAMAHAVYDAALRLHALADAGEVSPTALRTTLILVATLDDLMLVSHVGDGAVLVQRRDGRVQRVGAQRETAWAGEVSCFVPDACAMAQAAELRQVQADDVTLIAVMTDGIDDPFHPLEQTGEALVAQWCHGATASIGTATQPVTPPVLGDVNALLAWMSFEQRGEVDDRTLLLARRIAAEPA